MRAQLTWLNMLCRCRRAADGAHPMVVVILRAAPMAASAQGRTGRLPTPECCPSTSAPCCWRSCCCARRCALQGNVMLNILMTFATFPPESCIGMAFPCAKTIFLNPGTGRYTIEECIYFAVCGVGNAMLCKSSSYLCH